MSQVLEFLHTERTLKPRSKRHSIRIERVGEDAYVISLQVQGQDERGNLQTAWYSPYPAMQEGETYRPLAFLTTGIALPKGDLMPELFFVGVPYENRRGFMDACLQIDVPA